VSAGVTIVAYGFLFHGAITTAIQNTPQFFLSLNSRRMSAASMRWSRIFILEILPPAIGVILVGGVGAGLGVSLWKLYTSNLSKGGKIGISFAIFFVPPVFSIQIAYMKLPYLKTILLIRKSRHRMKTQASIPSSRYTV
jgi:hypothetical protein